MLQRYFSNLAGANFQTEFLQVYSASLAVRRVLESWTSCLDKSPVRLGAHPSKNTFLIKRGQLWLAPLCTSTLEECQGSAELPLPTLGSSLLREESMGPVASLLCDWSPVANIAVLKYTLPPYLLLGVSSLCRCLFALLSVTQHFLQDWLFHLNVPQCSSKMHIHLSYLMKGKLAPSFLSLRKIKLASQLIVDKMYFIFQRQSDSDYKAWTEQE